ncbi:MAG: hypothetical protein K2O53_08055 [Bacteroidales bacterium]|nr:hypothetical protein [Bacteroidales bacterium]
MSIEDLATELDRFYRKGQARKERNAFLLCFGIKYADLILRENINCKDIVRKSSLAGTTYDREIYKGVKLAKYVLLRDNII